jgi:uncharacterized Ntn-hydrolase superfamily protein
MTYSIVAADTQSLEVGGAGTSCLTGDDVYVIYGGVPGRGVVHAQAYYSLDGRTLGKQLLAAGKTPSQIVAALTDAALDSEVTIRQYGVIDVLGSSAGYTGRDTMAYASDRQGKAGSFAYSVQGNILTSAKVLEQAATAFEASGCDLAEHLMNALEAGARGGEGDKRCTARGIPSDSAFLQVERPDGVAGDYLSLRVRSSGSDSPLPELRALLTSWRAEHPCPAPASTALDQPSGCGCNTARADFGDASAYLLCGLLVVAWRRQRAARDLRPIVTARQ